MMIIKSVVHDDDLSQRSPLIIDDPLYIKRDLAHVPTDKLKSLAETYERKLKIIGNSGSPEATKVRFRFEFVMQEIGIRQIVEDVEADLAKVVGR